MTLQAGASSPGLLRRVHLYLGLVRFSHTIFALPFAIMSLFLARPGEWPDPRSTLLILLAMVSARTAAMAYNRLVDREIDAENPRTRERHLPARLLGVGEVRLLVACSSLAFVLCAWFLNLLAFALSFPVLVLLLFYSHTKRFTAASHFFLGAALGLAPMGVWIAVHGVVDRSCLIPGTLGLAVLLWVAAFDILYSCQDVEFDRSAGLRSIPARLGIGRSLVISRLLHALMVVLLLLLTLQVTLGPIYLTGVAMVALLLLYEHALIRSDNLSRINLAFFTVNGCVSLLLCACTLLEVLA
ncbi:MAG: UbiA-like polyprenyltransferase [Planctomycetota bacterium]